jgi:hypothetical protein
LDNVYVLKYDIEVLKQLMAEFTDIKNDIEELANERERMRLVKERQTQMHIDEENKERIVQILKRIIKNKVAKK